MSTPAVLIYGPTSTGNHLAKEVFRLLGCTGSVKDVQRFDTKPLPPIARGPIMWGHSMPSQGHWLDIGRAIAKCLDAGYAPHLVGLTRAQYPAVQSAVDLKRVASIAEAESEYVTANLTIAEAIDACRRRSDLAWTYLAYEDLTRHPIDTTRWLAERIGLRWPGHEAWAFVKDDNNAKHWRRRELGL